MADAVHLQPVAAQGQQQPAAPHRPVGEQQRPLSQPSQFRQLPCGILQGLRREIPPERRRKELPGGRRRQHGHRLPRGIPQAVAAVVEGCEGYFPACPADPQPQVLPRHPLPGRRPEDHAQHQVGCQGGDKQHPEIHPGIEDAPLHRHPAGEEPQGQHAARHAAGEGEEQQRPPEEAPLPAEGQPRQQKARRQLPRPGCQPPKPRQEDRRRVSPAEGSRQQAAPPPGGNAGEQLRSPEQEVVHQGVQQEHAVKVHHRHAPAPPLKLPETIISPPGRKDRRKRGTGKKASGSETSLSRRLPKNREGRLWASLPVHRLSASCGQKRAPARIRAGAGSQIT